MKHANIMKSNTDNRKNVLYFSVQTDMFCLTCQTASQDTHILLMLLVWLLSLPSGCLNFNICCNFFFPLQQLFLEKALSIISVCLCVCQFPPHSNGSCHIPLTSLVYVKYLSMMIAHITVKHFNFLLLLLFLLKAYSEIFCVILAAKIFKHAHISCPVYF